MRRLAFTFEVIDDLALALLGDTRVALGSLSLAAPTRLGPLLEWLFLRRAQTPLKAVPLEECEAVSDMDRALSQNAVAGLKYGAALGVLPLRRHSPSEHDQTEWHLWCARSQQAAEAASFPKPLAQGLLGALREIEDNVHEHSQASHTGVAAYLARPNYFEFVVADAGIGVLASLQQSDEFAKLRDGGDALCIALSDGASRFGRASGHGYGFRKLFTSLAGYRGSLRFRSGDHALTINGETPQLAAAAVAQKVWFQGFIVSVSCRMPTA